MSQAVTGPAAGAAAPAAAAVAAAAFAVACEAAVAAEPVSAAAAAAAVAAAAAAGVAAEPEGTELPAECPEEDHPPAFGTKAMKKKNSNETPTFDRVNAGDAKVPTSLGHALPRNNKLYVKSMMGGQRC